MGKVQDFKVIKTNIDSKFIGKHISLEDVTHFTDGIVQPKKPRKRGQAPSWFVDWNRAKFEPLVNQVTKLDNRVTKLDDRVTKIDKRLIKLDKRVSVLESK